MTEMQKLNMSWLEVQFLRKAVDILCRCRQTLMYTYVFAYYLRKNNQSIIFEVYTFQIRWFSSDIACSINLLTYLHPCLSSSLLPALSLLLLLLLLLSNLTIDRLSDFIVYEVESAASAG